MGVEALVGEAAGQEVPDGHSQGEHVAVAASHSSPQHFGGLVAHRPQHNVIVLQAKSRATPKVRYLEVTRVCEQHVARLEVPVGQAVGVQVGQTAAYIQYVPVLKGDPDNFPLRKFYIFLLQYFLIRRIVDI